jgi:hypothetical protein
MEVLLLENLLMCLRQQDKCRRIDQIAENRFYIFQQDGAFAHNSKRMGSRRT